MKMFKKLAVVMLAITVLFGTMTVPTMAASNSPAKKTFTSAALKKTSTTYNGKTQKPAIKTVKAGKKTLKLNKDFKVYYPKNMKSAGKKVITIKGIGKYAGYTKTVTYTVKPATQKVSVSKSKLSLKRGKAATVKVKKKTGTVTWKSSNSKAVKVSKNGRISVAKKAKKGTYTITVTVKKSNYKTVTKKIKVRVK